jgi:hypothetical protein
MQVIGIQPDFVERFKIFTSAYDRARSREEKTFLTEEFLKRCTEDEVRLVRNVIDNVLHTSRFTLSNKLFN